jgi:hypothetical protein
MSQNTGDPVKATPKAAPAPVAATPAASDDYDDEPAPVAPAKGVNVASSEAAAGGDSRAQDILAMIRNRQKQ